jgi:hypothetical protein
MVYKLYNLTEEEIQIVEESIWLEVNRFKELI